VPGTKKENSVEVPVIHDRQDRPRYFFASNFASRKRILGIYESE
jgi:hypothetical protein